MALIAETIVEEYENLNKCFTIRGIKYGSHNNNEIDLLSISLSPDGSVRQAKHIEVQASTSETPIKYISTNLDRVSKEAQQKHKKTLDELLKDSVKAWVDKKFKNEELTEFRKQYCSSVNWQFVFVHGNVKSTKELKLIKSHGIHVIPFNVAINALVYNNRRAGITSSVSRDIIEIMRYSIKKNEKDFPK